MTNKIYIACEYEQESNSFKVIAISNMSTYDINQEAILDDATFDFSKMEGYIGYTHIDGNLHVKFDQSTYDAYLKELQKKEAQEKAEEEKQNTIDGLVESALKINEALDAIKEALPDETASKHITLFDTWKTGTKYTANERIVYDGKLYKVLQAHTSQDDWTPNKASSLFAEILTSTVYDNGIVTENDVKEWTQPDSTNPYKQGDKVKFNDKIYESLIDNNVWFPEAYPVGWKEV
jgi:hypothetical protein